MRNIRLAAVTKSVNACKMVHLHHGVINSCQSICSWQKQSECRNENRKEIRMMIMAEVVVTTFILNN